jgi:4-O-beta-D-mannosyl-D-glucose phosphorylase
MEKSYRTLVSRKNVKMEGNGVLSRYRYPVITAAHIPPEWRYGYNPRTNPFFMERLGINAVFNAGAILHNGLFCLACRVEGTDRKSFLAVARSANGIDGFRFDPEPVLLPETEDPDINVYDMRLRMHDDGWIYGIFCSERKDPAAPPGDTSTAVAAAGIARTKDLLRWERLPDLVTPSPQQRNVALHPEFVKGAYFLYTRPQDAFIDTGAGGGICGGLVEDMTRARVAKETLLDPKAYHTTKEVKNGAGLRYVLYAFLTDLGDPARVIARPGGYLLAPEGKERVGDVSNVLFSNGVVREGERLLVYYASSDTRLHVAETTVAQMLDFCLNTPPDGGRRRASVEDRLRLIRANRAMD